MQNDKANETEPGTLWLNWHFETIRDKYSSTPSPEITGLNSHKKLNCQFTRSIATLSIREIIYKILLYKKS